MVVSNGLVVFSNVARDTKIYRSITSQQSKNPFRVVYNSTVYFRHRLSANLDGSSGFIDYICPPSPTQKTIQYSHDDEGLYSANKDNLDGIITKLLILPMGSGNISIYLIDDWTDTNAGIKDTGVQQVTDAILSGNIRSTARILDTKDVLVFNFSGAVTNQILRTGAAANRFVVTDIYVSVGDNSTNVTFAYGDDSFGPYYFGARGGMVDNKNLWLRGDQCYNKNW